MPRKFARTYPSKNRINFDGGLNNKFEKAIIQDNESPDCANVIFENGAVETRGGTDLLNTTSVGTLACNFFATRHDNDGSETMVAVYGTDMYYMATTTFTTIASAQSVFATPARVGYAEQENYMFMGEGTMIPHKYDGSLFTRHGVYPPVSSPTAATGATGQVSGEVSYKVTYVNSALVEGNVSSASVTMDAGTGTEVTLSSIPTGDASFGVNSRRVYRSVSGATFLRVAEVAGNAVSIYTDNSLLADLTSTEPPSDNGVPPNYSICKYHQNRLFMNDPSNLNYVWYSDLNTPYVVGSTNFIRVGDNTADLVRGFEIYDNALVIFCDESIWMVYMPSATASDWVVVKARSSFGCKSPHAIVKYRNRLFFPAMQSDKFVGFAEMLGDAVKPDATLLTISAVGSDNLTDRIEPDMFQVQTSVIDQMSAYVYKNKIYCAVTYEAGNTTNNRIYVYDFSISRLSKNQQASWVPWTGLNAEQFTVLDGVLYYGASDSTGTAFEMNTSTYNDNSSAIDSYYWTKEYSGLGGEENFHKDFRYATILYEKSGDYFMDVIYRSNSDKGVGQKVTVDLDPGGSLWGTMQWGRDSWGGGQNEDEIRQFLGQLRGKRVQFKFSNQGAVGAVNQKFKIIGLNFVYSNKGSR